PWVRRPRQENGLEAVLASHGLIPEAVEQGPGPHGAKADDLAAGGPVDRRQGGGPNLFSPRVERPFVEDQEVCGQRPARVPGGGQCPEDRRLPARVLDGERQGSVVPDGPGVPRSLVPAVADHPAGEVPEDEGHAPDQLLAVLLALAHGHHLVAWAVDHPPG